MTQTKSKLRTGALFLAMLVALTARLQAQQVRVGDLTITESNVPFRLVGYGLVVGLDGTGDRAIGGFGARHTVQSVVNLLRNFGVEVPAEVLRTRNVAAVLVTAEASAYLRPGGRFEVQVASMGDAQSLRGGVLWSTPLVYDPGGPPVATAQGPLMISEGVAARGGYSVETSARIPDGALLLADLPRPAVTPDSRLLLREPNMGNALKIADAINAEIGENTARVEDPGAVVLTVADTAAGMASVLGRIAALRIDREAVAQVLVDTRDGTVVVGGEVTVGPGVVSHGGLTLAVGSTRTEEPTPGEVRVAQGASVQDVAAALHAVGAPAPVIAAIFESLHKVGALAAEVKVR
jgi:flagellar P-ring protein precursor FlgI